MIRRKIKMIKVTERYYITANSNQYTVLEKTTIKDETSKNFGNEVFRDVGYYPTIEMAIKGIKKVLIREYCSKETTNTLNELLEEIKKQDEFLKKIKLDI
jgi:hypothetical protein